MKIQSLFRIITLLLQGFTLSSCSSLNLTGTENYISSSLYKGGYWGTWKTEYQLTGNVNYIGDSFTLLIYNRSDHPSDYQTKIMADRYVKKDGDWFEYTGKVELLLLNDDYEKLCDYYSTKVNYYIYKERYISFPCTIRTSKPIKDIFKKHGTINVFYNGVGRVYSF